MLKSTCDVNLLSKLHYFQGMELSTMWTGAELLFSLYFRYYTQTFFVTRLIINIVQWVDFKLGECPLISPFLKNNGTRLDCF